MDNINDIEVNNPEFVIKKQTAVEWLYEQISDLNKPILYDYFQTVFSLAKEMEKQQIIDAHENGIGCIDYGYGIDYYNETFKNK
jgi:hypothetical protein